jgi:hypothetical protein
VTEPDLEMVKQMVADALGVQAARLTVTTKRPRKGRWPLVEARIGGCRVSTPWAWGMPVVEVVESLVNSFKYMVEMADKGANG